MRIKCLVVAISLSMVACGGDDDNDAVVAQGLIEQLEAVGLGQYLGRDVPAPTQEDAWMRYDFALSDDGPKCLFGTPYKVYVRPGTNDKVLFYLEGGGGCWDEESCFGETQFGAKTTSDPIAPLAVFQGGIFATSNPDNPFDGWNVLYVPYCDGSVFSGDNVVEYDRGTVYHRGQVNLSAAIDVMRDNFPAPSEIVVSGSSAGGFGTFPGYGVMRVAYPDTPMLVLNDSGPGVQNNDDVDSVNERRDNWRFQEFIVTACDECFQQPAFLTDWALDNDSQLRVALFSYLNDFVISGFLNMEGDAYRDLLLDVSGEIQSRQPDRFKRYFVQGASHVILLGAGVGPDGVTADFDRVEIDGIGLRAWLRDFLSDGPDWRDLIEPDA